MEELDIDGGKDLPEIFNWQNDLISFAYRSSPTLARYLKIFAQREIGDGAKRLYFFKLVNRGGFFSLKVFIDGDGDEVAISSKKDNVIHFVTERIIRQTTLGADWLDEHPDQKEKHLADKEELRKILRELIGNFIR